jgi:hypothetical protein
MRLTTATRKLRAPSSLREKQFTFSSERGRKSPGGFISEKEREAQRYAGEENKKIKKRNSTAISFGPNFETNRFQPDWELNTR